MAPSTFLDVLWRGGGVERNSHIVQVGLELTMVIKVALELKILLPLPPKPSNCRCRPPLAVTVIYLFTMYLSIHMPW